MTFTARIKRKIRRSLKRAPNGSNGVYIQLSSKRGVKILRYEHPSIDSIIQCNIHKLVYEEARTMKRAKQLYPYIPECYGVKMFKIYNFYTMGIIIQHLGNKRISDVTDDCYPTIERLEKELYAFGICHNDIHSNNIMYFKNKYWVIDFDDVYFNESK